MPPLGDPQCLNAAGWLDIATETCIRLHAADMIDGLALMAFAADLVDEIDRLRALLVAVTKDGLPVHLSSDVQRRICDALANIRAQEF